MKKLIIILFLFTFSVNAQIQLSEDWSFKPDKAKHSIAGSVIGGVSYISFGNNPNWGEKDIDTYKYKYRAALIMVSFSAMGKEYLDVMMGKEISLADMSYTIFSGMATAWIFKRISIHRYKKRKAKFNIEF